MAREWTCIHRAVEGKNGFQRKGVFGKRSPAGGTRLLDLASKDGLGDRQ